VILKIKAVNDTIVSSPEKQASKNKFKGINKVSTGNLRKAGLKVTVPRKRILELLEEAGNKHVTADDIYRVLMQAGEDVGLATVYRVLNQFETAGLVVKHNFEGGQAYYELDSGDHHDHMVCVETGKVIEFSNSEIERLQAAIAAEHGYDIEDHSLVIYVRPRKD
jgi:Fur family ferric uptake transcriptional regulator